LKAAPTAGHGESGLAYAHGASPTLRSERLRPYSALINTLIVSLFALIPGHGFGEASFLLAVVDLASTLGLIIFFLQNRRREEPSGPDRFSSSSAPSCPTRSS
jgi:hypothetical protein